jgi:hypothetical protein
MPMAQERRHVLCKGKGEGVIFPNAINRIKQDDREQYAHIVKSIHDYGFIPTKAIIVDAQRVILDGHHRYFAALECDAEFHYLVNSTTSFLEEIAINSLQKAWTLENFMNAYADAEYADYIVFRKFMEEYKFPVSTCIALMSNGERANILLSMFKLGTFKIKDLKFATRVANHVFEFSDYFPSFYKHREFIYAIMDIMNNAAYKPKRMISKIAYQSGKVKQQVHKKTYLQALEEVYNFKAQPDDKIRFT